MMMEHESVKLLPGYSCRGRVVHGESTMRRLEYFELWTLNKDYRILHLGGKKVLHSRSEYQPLRHLIIVVRVHDSS